MEKIRDFLSHLFVPKSENNYRARALHPDFLTYYLILALVLTFTFKNFGGAFSNVLGYATDITTAKLFELTNAKRSEAGLGTLTYSDKLSKAAENKAHDMFANNYWSHFSPSGKSPWDFILGSGYKYEYAGENLAKNFLFSQGVIDAWMNSPLHKENLLRPQYTEVGYAVVNGILNGEETTLVVQMFGKPLSTVSNKEPMEVVTRQQVSSPVVLAKETNQPITVPKFSMNISVLFILFLGFALIMDLYFAAKTKVIRISGKHVAHLIFLGFLFIGIMIFAKGAII